MAETCYATAVDLGATKVLCALISSKGKIIVSLKEPTAKRDAMSLVSQIASLIKRVNSLSGVDESSIMGVGIAVPGLVESSDGVVAWAPNLTGWRNLPLKKLLRENFGIKIPVFVDDDRVTSILGEQWLGAARGAKDAVYLIIGTGIGAGILVDGKPYKGRIVAGAVGWMLIGENFMDRVYDKGCLESFASGPNIARRAIEEVKKGTETIMERMVNGKVDQITSEVVFEAARKGDKVALNVVKETAKYLGIAISNIVSILNPEVVVMGGGVGAASDLLLDDIETIVKSYSQPYAVKGVKIAPSMLGANASLLGSAKLVFMHA
jgi:glucokinase